MTSLKDIVTAGSRRHADSRSMFAAGAVALSLLLLAAVLQAVVPGGRAIVQELPAPDFGAMMPAGAAASGPVLTIPDLPQPSYMVPYVTGEAAGLMLVEWDRDAARYAVRATLTLADGPAIALDRVDAISLEPAGFGTDVFMVRGPSGTEAEAAFLVARDARGLSILPSTTEEGTPWPAFFRVPAAMASGLQVTFEDVDGDGRNEALYAALMPEGETGESSVVMAYRWSGNGLVFDPELTRLVSMSRSLFPEPPQGE